MLLFQKPREWFRRLLPSFRQVDAEADEIGDVLQKIKERDPRFVQDGVGIDPITLSLVIKVAVWLIRNWASIAAILAALRQANAGYAAGDEVSVDGVSCVVLQPPAVGLRSVVVDDPMGGGSVLGDHEGV